MNISNEVPQSSVPVIVLGLGGLIPFALLPFLALMLDAEHQALLLHALVLYGAVICTFVGALHWGYAIRGGSRRPWIQYSWSIAPALIAWIAALLPAVAALRILACLLLVCYAADRAIAKTELVPEWFMRLRSVLTIVGSSLLLAASCTSQ